MSKGVKKNKWKRYKSILWLTNPQWASQNWRGERKGNLWDLAKHLRSAEGHGDRCIRRPSKLSMVLAVENFLTRSGWRTQPTPAASDIRKSKKNNKKKLLPRPPLQWTLLCLRKPVQLARAHWRNLGCVPFCCGGEHNDPEHQEPTRDRDSGKNKGD